MGNIEFGTDGWRAKMGGAFSFRNVRIFAQAYCNYLKKRFRRGTIRVPINYDTRFLSRRFALEAAKVFSLNGIEAILPSRDFPIPTLSYAITRQNLNGGLGFTASFNAPIYNGIKLFDENGSPALPSKTALIEEEIKQISSDYIHQPQYADSRLITTLDVRAEYLKYLEERVDFDKIRESGIKIIVDNLYGTSRGFLDSIFLNNGIDILSIHNYPDSSFGGVIPSCTQENLRELSDMVKGEGADVGLSTDIDSDRFGIIDSSGRFISSNVIMPPLIEYLISVRGFSGGIVKSISTTDTIYKVAEAFGRKVYDTPVGFKFLAHMMRVRKAFVAVESTNGAALSGPVRVKDGILFSLLVAEMMAHHKMRICQILSRFYKRYPRLFSRETGINFNRDRDVRYNRLLIRKAEETGALKAAEISYIDGVKYIFSDGWLLLRRSGTDKIFRVYAEADTYRRTLELIRLGRGLIG